MSTRFMAPLSLLGGMMIVMLAHASPAAPDVDAALAKIESAALETHSDAVFIVRNGEVLLERYSDSAGGRPIELMSAAKSVVALGVGLALTDRKLASLDVPVAELFPEWRQGRKRDITVRMLLDHTSGLQNLGNAGVEIYPAPDVVQLALAAELQSAPGAEFAYNNKAVNLLAAVIGKAVGEPMDVYLRRGLFEPLGIEAAAWYKDAAGTPMAMAGLELSARDAAKLGQLILDGGRAPDGTVLIEQTFIDQLVAGSRRSPQVGLLWWRIPTWEKYALRDDAITRLRQKDVPSPFLVALGTLKGKEFASREELFSGLAAALGVEWLQARQALDEQTSSIGLVFEDLFSLRHGEIVAWLADGFLGQYIVVVPSKRLVAVRQIARRDEHRFPQDTFSGFASMVIGLAGVL